MKTVLNNAFGFLPMEVSAISELVKAGGGSTSLLPTHSLALSHTHTHKPTHTHPFLLSTVRSCEACWARLNRWRVWAL